jgi:hypothetical protein
MANFSKTKLAGDDSLEQSFFQLAYNKLQDSLKNLLPFLIGFEIVKKNEDNTKALGVFGFRSHSGQILYVPAFFIDGKVKNLDLLYSKNNEQFYPLNEDFAEMFLKDETTSLGGVAKEPRQKVLQDMTQGDYRQMTIPPRTGKYTIASCIDYVKDSDNKTKKAFTELLEKDAEFCEAVLRFYPIEKVAEAVVETEDGDSYRKENDVKVVMKDQKPEVLKLDEKQRKDVMTQGFVVVDKRPVDKKSKFGVVDYVKKFQNPTESGFYPYVTSTGTINYGLILVRPKQLQQDFATDDAIVINLDSEDKGSAYIVDTKMVYTKDQLKVDDYSLVHKMMVDPAEAKPSYTSVYVLLNEHMKATQPFRINANFKDAQGIRRISVEPFSLHQEAKTDYEYQDHNRGPKDRPGSVHDLTRGNYYRHPRKAKEILLVMTKKPGDSLDYHGHTLYVPSGYKLLEVKFHPLNEHGYCGVPNQYIPLDASDKAKSEADKEQSDKASAHERYLENRPGGSWALNSFLSKNNIFPMTVRTNGSEYFSDIAGAKKKYDNPMKAKIAMVTEVGLDFKQACEIIDNLTPAKNLSGHVKLAYTGDYYPIPYEEAPYTNQVGQPTYVGVGQESRLPADIRYTGDPTALGLTVMPEVEGIDPSTSKKEIDPRYVNQATQMAQGGQKEIFDVQTMATLAKYVGVSDKITEYVPSLIEGMDRLGRILFLLNWDTDKFVEMYGRNDLPELVELVSNVFKNLGDLVIFLKRKSPELTINMGKEDALEL